MVVKISRRLAVVTLLLVVSYLFPCCFAQNYSQSYQILDSPDGSIRYRLNVVVPESLYEYYYERSHRLGSSSDFAKFVTPYALSPIAESLWEICSDGEDFANGVLMIVHQIPYNETLPVKYPVETIVTDKGDCDLFSYIAASILKAGGLDVVLLYYESEAHMNVGVHLPQPPNDVRGRAHYVTYNDARYYVAECTGGNWNGGWRVGEFPDGLDLTSITVITLERSEEWAPGKVSASYETLKSSTISLITSPPYTIQGSPITISGQLSPNQPQEAVTIYIKANNFPWTVLDTVTSRSDGKFSYTWKPDVAGVCYIRASWYGDTEYAGADSTICQVMIFSVFFVLLLTATLVLVCVGTVVFLKSRLSGQHIQEPLPPAIPS